jgi:hypothetical protein
MHVGVHLCRGNFVGGRHFSEGGYDRIATKLFRNLGVENWHKSTPSICFFLDQKTD